MECVRILLILCNHDFLITMIFVYQGDTGDPAVHFSGMNRAGTLFGIALFSGTEECAYKAKPGIFAKVPNQLISQKH